MTGPLYALGRDVSEMHDFNSRIINEFRASGGKVGPPFDGAPMVLLTTTGARSGAQRTMPLVYLPDGDRIVVFASKAGSPTNPDWYHNLRANPDVTVEVGADTKSMRAVEVTGAERDRLFAEQKRRMPGFADYEQKTTRVIPVIALVDA
ncbi:MAG TPA: nitroreductase family deazaflavin-dependent oxidoreductase [Acidimicrobiales bacterium]|nr:nitroreductase family deazaflavin-dependent oxidoreductase [Acidimicrobiales bacterium]